MSQSDTSWMDAATDPYLPSIKQESDTEDELEKAFTNDIPDEPVFTPLFPDDLDDFEFTAGSDTTERPPIKQETYTDDQLEQASANDISNESVFTPVTLSDLDDFDVTAGSGADSQYTSSNPSTVSTPDFGGYSFSQQPSPSSYTVPTTPQPYPTQFSQLYQSFQPAFHQRPLPFRTHTESSFVLPTQPPQGYDRRRSLSHGDIDRNATVPPHPALARLQGLQASRARSHTPDGRRSEAYIRHTRSASHGHGRTPKYTVPSPRLGHSNVRFGHPIGDALYHERSSRKRLRPFYSGYHDLPMYHNDPYLARMNDPLQLQHSRRIVEIGAMGVQDHMDIDPKLENENGSTGREGIMKKLGDIEQHLNIRETIDEEALKACAVIRAALDEKAKSGGGDNDGAVADQAAADLPSTVMATEDSALFNDSVDDNKLMSLLIEENQKLGVKFDGA